MKVAGVVLRALLASLCGCLLLATTAYGSQTFTVDNNDTTWSLSGSGTSLSDVTAQAGSLPWAIASVDFDSADTAASPDVIEIESGVGTVTLSQDLPALTNSVTIEGNGTKIDGAPGSTVACSHVSGATSSRISRLVMRWHQGARGGETQEAVPV